MKSSNILNLPISSIKRQLSDSGQLPSLTKIDHGLSETSASSSSISTVENVNNINRPSSTPAERHASPTDSAYHDETIDNNLVLNAATIFKRLRLNEMEPQQTIDFICSQIIGRSLIIDTVFGQKLKLYCDYTASGQELRFVLDALFRIEEYYANTHTEISKTGAFMNKLLDEAEAAILKATRASEEDYFIVAGGGGCTYAVEMAQKFLGTYIPPATRQQMLKLFPQGTTWQALKSKLRSKRQLPLVITSHYEHHSNEVTWRIQLCDIVQCQPGLDGHVDLACLERLLKQNRNRPLIGSFSAGSNVSGIKTDVFAVASLLKKYNALALFDYAAVGPYVRIDLSRKTEDGRCLIDGIYVSPHKFIGGPGASGLLIFNRKCYNSEIEPSHGGGGTVDFVSKRNQIFTKDPSHREKSGTPAILQVIKAGLAFQLKTILQPVIETKESANLDRFYAETSSMRNLRILGPPFEHRKVPIMSFIISHDKESKTGRFLHQNLVVRLLNDVFGIQARAGCSCAGPYGMYLLNIDDDTADRLRFFVETHPSLGDNSQLNGLKIGWSRVNLHFTLTDFEVDYLLFALAYICDYGHRFLPVYQFNPVTGQWLNTSRWQNSFPNFSFESILSDERRYAESEQARHLLFDRQREEALALLEKLPVSKELDSIPEVPFAFFYVEKSMLLEREKIVAKAKACERYFNGGFTSADKAAMR